MYQSILASLLQRFVVYQIEKNKKCRDQFNDLIVTRVISIQLYSMIDFNITKLYLALLLQTANQSNYNKFFNS